MDPDILAEAAMKLETLKADLSSDQTEAVLTRLAATMDSRLKRLSLHKSINLESMDPVILAEALIKLEFIGVHWFRLSATQLTSLISKIRHSPDMRIIMLCLNYTDLSPVPPEILIEALQKVKDVFIMFTRLTAEQFTAILTMVKENRLGRLQRITIWDCHIEGQVSPALLEEAKQYKALDYFHF